ncbi:MULTISPECIES: hypothetical protein, partial [unclassified Mesorhizobium]|uniref:hypothetical protein n=1 Tax=unclassified Mesorhizobium TaxID=325217 RepID=UPI001FE0104A
LLHQLHLSGKLIASIEDTALDLRPNDVRQLNMKWSSTRLNHASPHGEFLAGFCNNGVACALLRTLVDRSGFG